MDDSKATCGPPGGTAIAPRVALTARGGGGVSSHSAETSETRDAHLFHLLSGDANFVPRDIYFGHFSLGLEHSQGHYLGGVHTRGWTRTLRLARTIADLEGGGPVRRAHVAEALVYRRAAGRSLDATRTALHAS